MEINRIQLLSELEKVQPGLSTKDTVEQSSCVAFSEGRAYTFNDEVLCSCKTSLSDVSGAVSASPLLEVLNKMPEETLDVSVDEGKFLVKGKRRRASIRMEEEVTMAISSVNVPPSKDPSWKELPAGFGEAMEVVRRCVKKKEQDGFCLCCVHVSAKWMEASDQHQAIRFPIKTGFSESVLIHGTAALHVGSMVATHYSLSDSWIHFKNIADKELRYVMSCRRYLEEFPSESITRILATTGEPLKLPLGIGDAAKIAQVFSKDSEYGELSITLAPGKMKVTGEGLQGSYSETKKIKYDGPQIRFSIAPEILSDIISRQDTCEISKGLLKIEGGNYQYATCLGTINEASDE
jgi:hypothetical protein